MFRLGIISQVFLSKEFFEFIAHVIITAPPYPYPFRVKLWVYRIIEHTYLRERDAFCDDQCKKATLIYSLIQKEREREREEGLTDEAPQITLNSDICFKN